MKKLLVIFFVAVLAGFLVACKEHNSNAGGSAGSALGPSGQSDDVGNLALRALVDGCKRAGYHDVGGGRLEGKAVQEYGYMYQIGEITAAVEWFPVSAADRANGVEQQGRVVMHFIRRERRTPEYIEESRGKADVTGWELWFGWYDGSLVIQVRNRLGRWEFGTGGEYWPADTPDKVSLGLLC